MRSRRQAIAVLATLGAITAAPAAQGAVDYTKNAAGGEYAPAITSQSEPAAPSSDSGFAWDDAAIGAGAALGVVLVVGGLGRRRSRDTAAVAQA
jgi:hypothetical protein